MFTWRPMYKEIVEKIQNLPGNYQSKGKKLIKVIEQINKKGVETIKIDFPVDFIDPFTFFAIFNRQITEERRLQFLESLKSIWNLQEDIPKDFSGIPVLISFNIRFFEDEDDLEHLWTLFELICSAKRENFPSELSQAFDKCLEINGVGIPKLTIGLFWIRPDLFIPLDKNVRKMLDISDNDINSFEDYKQLLKKVRKKFPNKKFWEVSYEAWEEESYSDEDLNRENRIEELLSNFPQIILYGPPGTGKTYFAKKVTAKLLGLSPEAGVDKKHPQHEEFKNARFGENKNSNAKGKWSIVQFHPSYNYEDFVRGIKIIPKGEGISYESVNKIFAKMCKEARKNSEENYVLLIDEINRANLAAVLGELIYALEYRGEAVDTPYEVNDDSKLIVPPNLYIIGTMNTADRSIGHIDYAVRRRFAFVQILPEENVIEQHYDNEEVKKVALTLFNTVKELFDEKNGYLSPDYHKEDVQIGHSYFIVDTSKEVEDQIEELAYKFSYQVFPLLKEYYKDGVLVPKEEDIKLKELDVSVTESIKPEELLKKIKNFFSLQISDLSEDDEEE